MSSPTPQRLQRHELKRKKERKFLRLANSFVAEDHKTALQFKVEYREEKSRGKNGEQNSNQPNN